MNELTNLRKMRKCLFLFANVIGLFLILPSLLQAQAKDTIITADGTYTLYVEGEIDTDWNIIFPPNCKAQVTYKAWGGGASAGKIKPNRVSGGGSGAYIECSMPISTVCGTTYTATVGAGGAQPTTDTGFDGGTTSVTFLTTATAEGGRTTSDNGNNPSGIAAAAMGCDVNLSGNLGGPRGNGISGAGATAPGTGGGAGGAGVADGADGIPGSTPGGGGSGHGGSNMASGKGGDGQIIIEVTGYECIICTAAQDTPASTGGSDGVATVTPTGGTAPYTFLWSDPAAQAAQMATGLAAGTYTVSVTDNDSCITTCDVIITELASSCESDNGNLIHIGN